MPGVVRRPAGSGETYAATKPSSRTQRSSSATQPDRSGAAESCGSIAAPRNRSGNIWHCWWIMSFTYLVHAGIRCGSIQPMVRNGRGPMTCTSMFRSSM